LKSSSIAEMLMMALQHSLLTLERTFLLQPQAADV
jgi:hypothetical protein